MLLLKRVLVVLGGALLLYANNAKGPEGTFLGFYSFNSAERLGYNVSKAAIAFLALGIITRGFGIRFRRNHGGKPNRPTTQKAGESDASASFAAAC
jgi:hypothetical protein